MYLKLVSSQPAVSLLTILFEQEYIKFHFYTSHH